jgi:hypothetical protein
MRPSLRPRGGGLSRRREPVEAGDGAAEVPWREVGVPHGHLQVGVSEQLLNFAEPHTAHDRPGGEGVAERVERHVIELRGLDSVLVGGPDVPRLEDPA